MYFKMSSGRSGILKGCPNSILPIALCLIVLCFTSVALSGKMGHVEPLSLKESVIRSHNGVMVMTLSPRKTVLSLSSGNKNGKNGFHTTKAMGHKPMVTFSKTSPSHSSSERYRDEDLADDSSIDDLIDNQTETVDNMPTSSSSSQSSPVDDQQGQSLANNRWDDIPSSSPNNPHRLHAAHEYQGDSSSDNIIAAATTTNNLRHDHASQLLFQSALRNVTNSGESGGGFVTKPEISQVWSNEEMVTIDDHPGHIGGGSSEESDFHAMIAGFLKREIWTIPLFVFASLNIVLITFFEIYVLCRTKGQSRRHLFLGQMLLFGLFLCSSLALLFAIYPSVARCFVGRLGMGFGYSLIFAVLMVKCIFLLSLDVGVYLPISYQGCLLFFSVLVQVAIDTQWTILFPPKIKETDIDGDDSLLLQCGSSYLQFLYSLSYIAFLMVLVGLLATKATCKGITENYRESIYILMSIIVSVPIAISWTVAGWILQGRHQDACIAFGLVAQSLTVFLIMFMPKGRQLAAMGKEGPYVDDQEDQCSGYSPSFFHFKPSNKSCKTTIFGDGNLYTTLEPTLSTINPNVFFHRADYHSGMIY